MTNAIGDILASKWDEPPEIAIIQKFVQDKFKSAVGVTVKANNQILITVPNAALAGSLRPYLYELQKQVGNKRLVLRIGA